MGRNCLGCVISGYQMEGGRGGMSVYTNVVERVPVGKLGSAAVVHDEPSALNRMWGAFRGMPLGRPKYARLVVNGETVMTDAEFERLTNLEFIRNVAGDVLIGGLGLGLILDPILNKQSVTSVTVVEINPDVIGLVGPAFKDHPKISIVQGDVYQWRPTVYYGTIYFDIWNYFNSDVSRLAAKLHRRYRKHLLEGGWMGSWCVIANRARGRGRR